MSKSIILFPSDASTAFLEGIVNFISERVPSSRFDLIRIGTSDEAHERALIQAKRSEYSTIIFLGHGTSVSLRGAKGEGYLKEIFLSPKEVSLFRTKNLVLISCDSIKFIKNIRKDFQSAIGFEDLPTDWNDVTAARSVDANAYKEFTQEMIDSFQNYLVAILKYSFVDFLNADSEDINRLYLSIQLRINKSIGETFKRGESVLSDCFLKVKSGYAML